MQIIGTCLINQLTNKWGRLVGLWLLGSYPVGFMVVLGLLSTNIAGSTKRSVASGWVFVCYCIGQIAGPQFFKSKDQPEYRGGISAMLAGFVLNLVMNQVLRFLYVRENKRRDQGLEGKSEEELARLQRESEIQGFEDVTDKNNVSQSNCSSEVITGLTEARQCSAMWYNKMRIKIRLCWPSFTPKAWNDHSQEPSHLR